MTAEPKELDIASIDSCIDQLRLYVDDAEIGGFISTLETVKQDPQNPDMFKLLAEEFDKLGPVQGAVLTYAPYIILVLSDDPHIPPENYEAPPGGFDDDFIE